MENSKRTDSKARTLSTEEVIEVSGGLFYNWEYELNKSLTTSWLNLSLQIGKGQVQ